MSTTDDNASYTAQQIDDLLDSHPELRDAIKQQIATRLQQQGTQMNSDDISDDILEQQIAANAPLRTSLTRYLQSRGYAPNPLQATTDDSTHPLSTSATNEPIPIVSGRDSASNRNILLQPTQRNLLGDDPSRGPADATADAIHKEPPYPLQSLRDLYTQVPHPKENLKRFGSDFFLHSSSTRAMLRGAVPGDAPLDMPVGPDYVIGIGDTLQVSLWGASAQSFERTVGRDGRMMLPEAGAVQIAALTLAHAEEVISAALKEQFRGIHTAVTVARFHTVRIYIAGDVQRPGGYDVSALASPLSALYAAGGPTASGSLRTLQHIRGNQVLENIDLYDFLLHGVHATAVHLESGDTLLVPIVGTQVSIDGAIKRPAIYELRTSASSLNELVQDAGGFTVAASLAHITVERTNPHIGRETITLRPETSDQHDSERSLIVFRALDGDHIFVSPVLPYSEKLVYLEGHVSRPGRQPFRYGMRLSDVIHSYADLLPEAATQAEIIRLAGVDHHAEAFEFDLGEALIGNTNPTLQPFDTIRIRGRYDEDAPEVTIHGEVLRPGVYPLSEGMTAAQLVRMAGGFKRDALLERADVASYSVVDGREIVGKLRTVRIGDALAGTSDADVPLLPGDILTIHQMTGWTDIGEAVSIEGQVKFPGSYGFTDGERLSSVLRRAGGFRSTAYPEGAVLVREQVRELETKSREELIRQIESNSAAARLSPNLSGADAASTLQLIKAQQEDVLQQLRSHPPAGRLVVHLDANIDSWAHSPADIELRRGDILTIPKRPGFVLVTGQVYNATAVTFAPGKTAGWYLARSGGANATANRKEIFVIRANGSLIGRHSGGWFEGDVLSTRLGPGDVVVVPQKIIGNSLVWRNLLTTAQLISSIAITAAVAGL